MGMPIPGYPDYMIETDGRIFSRKSKKWMKASIGNNGYYGLELSNSEGHKRLNIHRLVALAYIPNPNNYPQVNHKDENKLNNDVSNLEWCTVKYNLNYGTCRERARKSRDYSTLTYRINAIKNGKKVCKPVSQFTLTGEFVGSYESATQANRALGINKSHITECCKGKRKTAHGFVWKYGKGE